MLELRGVPVCSCALDGAVAQPIPFIPMPPLSSHGYFKPYGPGMPGRDHLKDAQWFVPDLINGDLSAVTILKPSPPFDEHAGYSVLETAEKHVLLLIQAVTLSQYWEDTAIFITYDDFGGWYDHVAPPVIDRWEPGGRVPLLVISPYARKGFIDSTFPRYDLAAQVHRNPLGPGSAGRTRRRRSRSHQPLRFQPGGRSRARAGAGRRSGCAPDIDHHISPVSGRQQLPVATDHRVAARGDRGGGRRWPAVSGLCCAGAGMRRTMWRHGRR